MGWIWGLRYVGLVLFFSCCMDLGSCFGVWRLISRLVLGLVFLPIVSGLVSDSCYG